MSSFSYNVQNITNHKSYKLMKFTSSSIHSMVNFLKRGSCALISGTVALYAHAGTLINGSFDAGYTGFSSGYSFISSGICQQPGTFGLRTNPQSFNPNYGLFGDHTTGTGYMMLVDGSPTANTTVWQETVTVSPNTPYSFSCWAAPSYAANYPTLHFTVNSAALGSDLTLSGSAGNWQEFSSIWNSGAATSALIRIVDTSTVWNAYGNDFALDDISMVAVPEPGIAALLLLGVAALRVRPLGIRSATTKH